MGELLGELRGLVGHVVHVIYGSVELDPSENCNSSNLWETSRDQLVPGIPAKSLHTFGVAMADSERYRVPMEVILKDVGPQITEMGRERWDQLKFRFPMVEDG